MSADRPLRILMVGSGSSPIPPPGWGAVALLIGQTRDWLVNHGHTCDILNKKHWRIVNGVRARPWTYDFVHLQAERRARLWVWLSRMFKFPLAITTYGSYAAFPERWKPCYRRIFRSMCGAPYLIAISNEIAEAARREGFRNRIFVVPSAIHCRQFAFRAEATRQAACVLGRVEERKKQAYLARVLKDRPVACDFIGPYKNSDVSAIAASPNMRLLGPWNRQQVQQNLTDYACSILLSDGEAHPLAVMESMAAGLSIVVSPEASHNLDPDQPFIYIVDRDDDAAVARAVEQAVRENHSYRHQIRRYVEENFDWNVIGPRYVQAARHITETGRKA